MSDFIEGSGRRSHWPTRDSCATVGGNIATTITVQCHDGYDNYYDYSYDYDNEYEDYYDDDNYYDHYGYDNYYDYYYD